MFYQTPSKETSEESSIRLLEEMKNSTLGNVILEQSQYMHHGETESMYILDNHKIIHAITTPVHNSCYVVIWDLKEEEYNLIVSKLNDKNFLDQSNLTNGAENTSSTTGFWKSSYQGNQRFSGLIFPTLDSEIEKELEKPSFEALAVENYTMCSEILRPLINLE